MNSRYNKLTAEKDTAVSMTVYTKSRKEGPSTEQIDNLTESVDELGSLMSKNPVTTEAISNVTSGTK